MVGEGWSIPPPRRDEKGTKRTANSAGNATEGKLGRRVQAPSKAPGFQESGWAVDVNSILSHQCFEALVFRAGVNFLLSFSLWAFSRPGSSKAMKKLLRWVTAFSTPFPDSPLNPTGTVPLTWMYFFWGLLQNHASSRTLILCAFFFLPQRN